MNKDGRAFKHARYFVQYGKSIALALLTLVSGTLAGAPARISRGVQPHKTDPPLVFDGVNVVDVERGVIVPNQRVVIVGNRISAIGNTSTVSAPAQAKIVDAHGKYLIPGLWDMHTHAARSTEVFYPLFVASGVTGIRDAGSPVPLDTLRLWRQEILSGTRIGPPRQVLSGSSLMDQDPNCDRSRRQKENRLQTCVTDERDARHVVDSLKAAGADMIKPRDISTKALYLAIADEARRQHIRFGGHITWGEIGTGLTYIEASDSGAGIIDHDAMGVDIFNCWGPTTTVATCGPVAEHFKRNDTWWAPTLIIYGEQQIGPRGQPVYKQYTEAMNRFWSGAPNDTGSLRYSLKIDPKPNDTTSGYGAIAQRVGMPILAATDVSGAYLSATWPQGSSDMLPGVSLHAELAFYAAEGLSPLNALQSATLNPAKFLHATDSLGTVTQGKLADLVLLDANPLEAITNTTTIRAVVANGRYFDRAALDRLLLDARARKP